MELVVDHSQDPLEKKFRFDMSLLTQTELKQLNLLLFGIKDKSDLTDVISYMWINIMNRKFRKFKDSKSKINLYDILNKLSNSTLDLIYRKSIDSKASFRKNTKDSTVFTREEMLKNLCKSF